ncbi:MAG: ABC transporter ATP-binding protein [Ruminococcaceae bacterium]|nr:ABC transporter ATP-binding protein [Oscillospiraceae bacterium]
MENIYTITGLAFRYPKGDRDVFHDVNLTLDAGHVLSILGPNGAGKSTLLNCMAALATPKAGDIRLAGQPLGSLSQKEIAQKVAYVQQNHVPAFSYTVWQYVLMGRAPHIKFFARPGPRDEEAVWRVLQRLDIAHLASKPYTEISGGERQQCVIARALVQEPKVILFDEPTAFLDYGNQLRVLRLMKKMAMDGYAVVMTTHNPDHVLLLDDQVAVLNRQGELQSGPTREILQESTLQQIYNTDLRVLPIEELHRTACLHTRLFPHHKEGGQTS